MYGLTVKSSRRNEMIDITSDIIDLIKKERFESGEVFIFVPHTTASVTINEGADPSVQRDIISFFNDLIPKDGDFHHVEGNSDAHIKASIFGASERILVEDSKLLLGTWQHVFFVESDGPRNRKVFVKLISYTDKGE